MLRRGCTTSNTLGVMSKRQRLEAAGEWLRRARKRGGYRTAVALADALGIDRSMVSRYESGISEVDDDRAQQIAEVLGLSLIEVRRGLGLWVPTEVPRPADDPAVVAALAEHLRYQIQEKRADLEFLDSPEFERFSRGTRGVIARSIEQEIERLEDQLAELPAVSRVRPDSVASTDDRQTVTNGS